ncbi:hypothetical protein Tsp_08430 [Trichinella spiralis]|uniref:hypothetical protein n=1 Tax=Trichinella spiralis TaxID=6334 RepID=UPI0001EFB585|nr:hypothetical protein Tsp_08430 [Trichinella spiralis]
MRLFILPAEYYSTSRLSPSLRQKKEKKQLAGLVAGWLASLEWGSSGSSSSSNRATNTHNNIYAPFAQLILLHYNLWSASQLMTTLFIKTKAVVVAVVASVVVVVVAAATAVLVSNRVPAYGFSMSQSSRRGLWNLQKQNLATCNNNVLLLARFAFDVKILMSIADVKMTLTHHATAQPSTNK